MAKSMLILWMMSSLIWQVVGVGRIERVPGMFIFGDSLGDAGTNNFIPNCTARADFSPYGVTSFLSPTGRFTNGLTVFDFIAKYLELPLIPPYRELTFKPLYLQQGIYSYGANFASGGSGLLDSTGLDKKVVKLSDQISKFEEFSECVPKKSYLGNSLYCISSGGNDIEAYFSNYSNALTPPYTPFVNSLVSTHEGYIQRLHRAGARKFLILDISAVGCTPSARLKYNSTYNGGCAELGNQVAQEYNTAMKKLVDDLNGELEDVNIIILNSYDHLETMFYNGEDFGFSETESACCGSGPLRANVSCGQTTPTDQYCDYPDTHLFWDTIHPTEKVYSIFSEKIWGGNSSFMHPFNLSTLVFGMNKK
ncbi:GDSL esterase/lipase 6-like [Cryptomeria japonica]|uniref:GDSL esterase/lipase 6-like n=1 Tax=Cryptomeria japonica TaxID=3369 RepID=UPI0027DA950E|nr:GDSL esterase/lipase 6-like [Cryptomeria japonica]